MKRKKPLKRTPLRRVSKKRQEEIKKYCQAKYEYYENLAESQGLKIGDTPNCEVCDHAKAKDIHHIHARGQGGDLLDPANFKAVCRKCHNWIHSNPSKSRENGLLI